MAVAIDRSVAEEIVEKNCSVETTGRITRGQMSVDWRPIASTNHNAKLVLKFNVEKLSKLYESALL